jgi:hypothetical protein
MTNEVTASDLVMSGGYVSGEQVSRFSHTELVDAVLSLRAALKESDERVGEFERTVDAAKEVLHCELWDVAIGKRYDILSLCCAAREQLADKRENDKKVF